MRKKDLKETINDRPVFILAQGPSLEVFEENVNLFKDIDCCYIAINRFDVMEPILTKIGKNFDMVCMSAQDHVNFTGNQLASFLHRDPRCIECGYQVQLVSSGLKEMLASQRQFSQECISVKCSACSGTIQRPIWICHESNLNQLGLTTEAVNYQNIFVANSIFHRNPECSNTLAVLLDILININTKKIFLFGCDGGPREGKTYYKVDTITGYHHHAYTASSVSQDTECFNNNFWRIKNSKMENHEIYNCCEHSKLNTFTKIDPLKVKEYL